MQHNAITTRQIPGKGRGKWLGFPTINMVIPPDISWEPGIYAAWVTISGKRFRGALHFGPIPVFNDNQMSLEVFLIDAADADIPDSAHADIIIEPATYLREVRNYSNPQLLVDQMAMDVKAARNALSS